MKKVRFALLALVIAAGSFAAFAFTKAEKKSTVDELHWFDAVSGMPIPGTSLEQQQLRCGEPGDEPCAYAYEEVGPTGNPIGAPVYTVTKEETK